MPICRNCGSRISKFDKDICPVCGAKHPLDGVVSETVEVTSEIDVTSPDFSDAKFRYKKTMLLWFCLLGFTGAGFFYLKMKKLAWLWLLLNILAISGIFVFLFFATPIKWFALLIAFGFAYLLNIIVGIVYYRTNSLKDGTDEFVR